MVASQVEVSAGVPANTPSSGWFTVPEGELGQINNALATMGHSLNPLDMFSLSGIHSIVDDTIQSIQQTIGLASGQTTAWTTIHATTAAQVYALEQSTGEQPYPTKAKAQAKAGAQNQNVNPNAQPCTDEFLGLCLDNLALRIAEIALGIILIGVGISKLSGADTVIETAAKVVK